MEGLTINEAAATTGWSPRMLRYIESAGLIDLPAGDHRLRAWHPGLTEFGAWVEQAVHVGAGADRAALVVPVEGGV